MFLWYVPSFACNQPEELNVACRVCDTFHLAAICGALYFYLITNYANPAAIFEQELWFVFTPLQ